MEKTERESSPNIKVSSVHASLSGTNVDSYILQEHNQDQSYDFDQCHDYDKKEDYCFVYGSDKGQG